MKRALLALLVFGASAGVHAAPRAASLPVVDAAGDAPGVAAYDAKIAAELAKWRYSPYEVDGKPVPVCTAVTFSYRQH